MERHKLDANVSTPSLLSNLRRPFWPYTIKSVFLKTVFNLRQNFFACLPAIACMGHFAVLKKQGGCRRSRRVGADNPGAWLPADTKGGPQTLSPGGGEGHRERLYAQ